MSSDKSEDVVLVLGNTGPGKSTFTQRISENSDKLITKKVAESTEKFLIEDNINKISKFSDNSGKWYTFLNSLYSKFSEYEIQKDKSIYNVNSLEDWGKPGKVQGIEINKNNFEQFLNKTAVFNIAEYDNIKNITITGLQLEELNHVLSLTLKHRMNISCIEPYISIRGNYISFKNIRGIIKNNTDMDDNCKEFSNIIKSERFKFINVFALNTVFIDEDVSLEGSLPITIIAPKWEVIDTRKIALNGVNGDTTQSKAKDGAYLGAKGTDGKPGVAGGPGGTFFGIGDQFINGANLTITVNGGIGGTGQNGGDGAKGINERNATLPSVDACDSHMCDNNARLNGFTCEYINCRNGGGIGKSICNYKIFAIQGGKGGTGGNGGIGGKGGCPGNIELFELNHYSGITRYNDKGRNGQNGLGGHGGPSGGNEYYQDIMAYCLSEWSWGTWYNSWHLQETIQNKKKPGNNGTKGIDGANTKGIEDPIESPGITELEKTKIINRFKSYTRENLNDRFKKDSLIEILNKLDRNNNVKKCYDILGLIDELQGLEEQFYKLNKDVNMLPFYQSLLDRISEYAKKPKEIGHSNQYKKILSYLYTATLGRIYNLQDNLESNLIVDITTYLDSVQEDNDKLKDLKKTKNKVDVINKYKNNYKNEIDIKIQEAKDLISKEITPEIENIGTDMDNKIDSLIDEVIALQEQTQAKQKELTEKKQQLESALALQGLFAPFKILGQVVSFLGPVGEVAGMAIEVGSTIAESFAVDGQNKILQLPLSASELKELQDRIKTIGNQKVNHIKKILEDISQGINEYPEKFTTISIKIGVIKDRLNKIDGNRFNPKEIQALENEIKLNLETQEKELRKTQGDISDQDTEKALVVIDNCKKAFQLTTVMFDTYNKYKNNQSKLDTINEAIALTEKKFKELKEFENKIYNTIAPLLQNVKNDLDDIANKLCTKSKVALDVTKWQVQSTLGDIELQMQQLTRNFEVKDNLVHSIKNLKDGMTTLINVYNHIQDYQEHQKFANYITDISSTTADDISSEFGEELGNAVRDLEVTIRSSIILQRHQVAIDAFKQFVFPFAHIYLKGLKLPSHFELAANENNTALDKSHLVLGANQNNTVFERLHFQLSANRNTTALAIPHSELSVNQNKTALDNLVYEATTQIEQIKSKLRQYKGSMAEHDGPIGIGEFSSHYDSTQPFFVWENELHKNAISKLLSGEEVVLKADITDSSPDEDAIKFNTIELNFNTNNASTQPTVNDILKGFNISTTHLGNSVYRYDDKIYPMTTNSQVIWYYFERKENGDPVRRSIAYDKLKNGDFMLSPYALWKIKLINLRNKKKFSFKDLEIYKDKIDLELGGNGYYVNKGGVKENLMVEKYYKAIDKQNLQVLNINNEKSNIVSMFQDRIFFKNKGGINQELKNEEKQTAMIGKYQVFPNGQESTKYEDSYRKPSEWYSWLKLPSFNFLPGAEAVVIKDEGLSNEMEYESFNLDDIAISLVSSMKLIKDMIVSKISKLSDYTLNSYSSENISNNCIEYIPRKDNTNSSINPAISFDGNKNSIQTIANTDINASLILGHLIVHKMFGNNKSLANIDYLSPEQEQIVRINTLTSEVLPIVNDIDLPNRIVNNSDSDYYNAPKWYQEMYKEVFE